MSIANNTKNNILLLIFNATASGDGVGAAAGQGSAAAVGASSAASRGASSGNAAAFGIGESLASAVGAASGVGAANGVGDSAAAGAGAGAASGLGAASGVGASLSEAAGAASGQGNVIAISDFAPASSGGGAYKPKTREQRAAEWQRTLARLREASERAASVANVHGEQTAIPETPGNLPATSPDSFRDEPQPFDRLEAADLLARYGLQPEEAVQFEGGEIAQSAPIAPPSTQALPVVASESGVNPAAIIALLLAAA